MRHYRFVLCNVTLIKKVNGNLTKKNSSHLLSLFYLSNFAPVGTKEQAKELVLFKCKDRNFKLKTKKVRVFCKKIKKQIKKRDL
jgi:hypothetical protein